MMYRVIAIVCAGLFLAACESNPDWMKSGSFQWGAPATESVRFESEPPGAEAKVSNGQSCRTPCTLALPSNAETTVNFNLAGYQPDTEKLDLVSMGDGTSQLRPNPVVVELTPAPPPKPTKKGVRKKKKTAARKAPMQPAAAATPQPTAQQPQQAPSPWPTTAPPQR